MKNLIICLFFSCSFLLGNSATASVLDGGIELTIVASKTGQIVCVFELPKEQTKGDKVEITLTQGKGNVVYSEINTDLTIALPATLSGTLYVTVKIKGFVFSKKIIL